jgi:hypothetical protein
MRTTRQQVESAKRLVRRPIIRHLSQPMAMTRGQYQRSDLLKGAMNVVSFSYDVYYSFRCLQSRNLKTGC